MLKDPAMVTAPTFSSFTEQLAAETDVTVTTADPPVLAVPTTLGADAK
jgi:hypothetical protein